jgi:hypothetical protein
MAMRDRIRKLYVVGVLLGAVAGVWTLGAVKAELDGPSGASLQVDPAIVRAAVLADPSEGGEAPEASAPARNQLSAS